MKKTLLSVAIILASTLGITATAQSPANTQTCDNPKTECTKAGKANKAVRPNPFEGLNLTEQQKTELQSIAPKKDCCKDKAEKKDKAQAKAEKQAKRAENRQKMIQNRRDYLAKVKNILTPEQYVQFLENNYVDQALKGGPRHGKMAQAKHKTVKKGTADTICASTGRTPTQPSSRMPMIPIPPITLTTAKSRYSPTTPSAKNSFSHFSQEV